jgi:hypothetical protein
VGTLGAIGGSRSLLVEPAHFGPGGHAVMRVPVTPGATHLRLRYRVLGPMMGSPVWRPLRIWPVESDAVEVMLPPAGAVDTGDPTRPHATPILVLDHPLPASPGPEVLVDIDQSNASDPCGPRPIGFWSSVLIDDVRTVTP